MLEQTRDALGVVLVHLAAVGPDEVGLRHVDHATGPAILGQPMKLARYEVDGKVGFGRVQDDVVVALDELAPTMEAFIEDGPETWERASSTGGNVRPLREVRSLAPIRPASLRDFLAFEDHARGGAARRNEQLNPAWYEMPVYYKGNHRQIVGPGEPVPWPSWTERLDFELELACIIGPDRRIFGYTVMNDWSARDVQRAEMAMRLGPAKSKDFATSLGPWIVTADEFDPSAGLSMRARIDNEAWFETSDATMHWTFEQMIAYIAGSETVYPCDVYGSGTPFGGCGLDQDRWLPRGATVELQIDGIGVLRNPVT
jgi:2-keto-4-pentenoate hydratase/2-oxohepta-3-ene-1,7-dioic acid hydratase in catechol pathway